jgi:hypothetical protein
MNFADKEVHHQIGQLNLNLSSKETTHAHVVVAKSTKSAVKLI